jgi:hypothetical protein
LKNIREILWEKGVTTLEEYTIRLQFYGNLNKVSEGSIPHMDFMEEVLARTEQKEVIVPDYMFYNKGKPIKIDDFGWQEMYTREERNYMTHGLASFKIYDK